MAQILQSPFEPVFHPMDSITIWGSRFKNRPIQLFTGFLDSSPYLQLYPGAITLTGSCTLKRLLYTYWDPGLTAILGWLASYGWIPNPQTGSVTNQGATTTALNKGNNFQLNDGSVANLVYGLLHDIGNWDDNEILIEGLPSGIVPAVQKIYKIIQENNQLASDELQLFLQTALGVGSQGSGSGGSGGSGSSGGTASGPVAGAAQIVSTVQPIAAKYNIPLELPLAVMYIETTFTNQDTPGNPHYGWFQCQLGGCYAYGPWTTGGYTIADTHDLGKSATAFCAAAQGWVNADPSLKNDLQAWAMKVQGVNLSNNPRYGTAWPTATATALSYISKFGGGSFGASVSSGAASAGGNTNPSTVSTTSTKPGAKNPSGSNTNPNGVTNPIPGFTVTAHDAGIDGTAPVGSAILAPVDSTLFNVMQGWYNGQPLLEFHFDQPQTGALSQYWYVAEQITPVTTKIGTQFKKGDAVAHFAASGTGIEIGWGDPAGGGNGTYAGSIGKGDFGHQPSTVSNSFVSFFGVGGGTPQTGGSSPSSSSSSSSVASGNVASTGTAAAFAVSLALPGLANQEAAALLVGEKSLMNCTSIFPFVQQVTAASMRNFQSLPDGTFFAFFPDYFGEFAKLDGKPGVYWSVPDIEIISGNIQLSDDALATHVYVVGDTIGSFGQGADSELINEIMSGGVMTIFEAFECGFVNLDTGINAQITGKIDAINFMARYGARPYINEDASFIRSPAFEAFMAFQTFQLMWARQFQTNFSFTFMPELYPGGRIELSDHGFQVYIDSVTHNFDYVQGFTTDAQLEAPSAMSGVVDNIGISKGMIRGDLLTAAPASPAQAPPKSPARGGGKK